jgi:hypothetical protein
MILFLFGSTEAYQLLKLPLLVKHFIEHKRENPAISVIAFLKMHYQKKIVVDSDFQKDMQLPFKTNDACCLLVASTSLPSPVISIEIISIPVVRKQLAVYKVNFKPLQAPQDIFQPPKFC